jgi:hypothetical protein
MSPCRRRAATHVALSRSPSVGSPRLDSRQHDSRQAIQRRLEQLEYEASRAFEQYDEADPRNRLVAAELERRWNTKLEELQALRERLDELAQQRRVVSAEERDALIALGGRFADVWNHAECPIELKKQIIRATIEEILVDETPPGTLAFIVHWKGGCHTAFQIPKPSPKTMHRTSHEDLDVIRKMASRYGDDVIAVVLNRLGRRTGKGRRWSSVAVKSARRNHAIKGHSKTTEDPDVLTLLGAVKYTGTSDTTIRKLVDAGVLPMRQVVPFAPWEIRRADLDGPRVRQILDRLRRSGRLVLGDSLETQTELFE